MRHLLLLIPAALLAASPAVAGGFSAPHVPVFSPDIASRLDIALQRANAALADAKPAPPATPTPGSPTATATTSSSTAASTTPASTRLSLLYHAKTGAVARYKNDTHLTLQAGGHEMTMEVKEVEKTTVTGVDATGAITFEQELESSEVSMNGETMPETDSHHDKQTVTIKPDGTLVSFTTTSTDKDASANDSRMFVASQPICPSHAIGIGDKWSRDYRTDSALHLNAAHADWEVLGFETVAGADSVKIRMEYHETEGAAPLKLHGTFWLERSTADVIQQDLEIENLPFGPEAAGAKAKVHSERIAGSVVTGTAAELAKTDPNRPKSIEEFTKDTTKVPGVFPIYRKKEADRDVLYMEVSEQQLDHPVMLQVTASTGTGAQIVAGDPINDILFQFHRRDNQLYLIVPNYKYIVRNNPALERALKLSFADGYLDSLKIEAESADKKIFIVNVTDMFQGDFAQITDHLRGGGILSLLGGGSSYSLDTQKTMVRQVKGYPANDFVQTDYHFRKMGGGSGPSMLAGLFGPDTLADDRSIPLTVDFCLFPLQETGYRPRLADPRVGYFTDGLMWPSVTDLSDDNKRDQEVRYIYRWNIEKAAPLAAMSPPKEPIVFWLDNDIPVEYRQSVRDGVLFWNKAFERIGIKDALVVKQMPDNASWDHADMRHNVIRWVLSPGSAYAVSLFRVNPLTGEILNADITIDGNLVRADKLELAKTVDPANAFLQEIDQSVASAGRLSMDPRRCEYAAGAQQQAWFGETALRLLDPTGTAIDHRAFIQDFLRGVVAHEVGHCLGLRHNFYGSTEYSLQQLQDTPFVKAHGTTASVMDYNPFNVAALHHRGVPYWTPTLGTYDLWAIEYGYKPIKATSSDGELPTLKAIASRSGLPGHTYQGDENADSFDPDIQVYDLGSDPLAYWQRELDVTRSLLLRLGAREPKKGQSYYEFTRDFMQLMNHYASSAFNASRSIGGLHLSTSFRGDAVARPALIPVPAAEQRRALGVLRDYIFDEKAMSFPRSYYTHFANDPNGDMMGPSDYPIESMTVALQKRFLDHVFDPAELARVVNNQYKLGEAAHPLSLMELFHTVNGAIWTDIEQGRNVDMVRRQLQRNDLNLMVSMALHPASNLPDDARLLAWDQLRKLRSLIGRVQQHPGLNDYTHLHLSDCLDRINQALNARETLGSSDGGGGLRLILGGA